VKLPGFEPAHFITNARFAPGIHRHGSTLVFADSGLDQIADELKGGVCLDVRVGSEQLLNQQPDAEDFGGVRNNKRVKGSDGGHGFSNVLQKLLPFNGQTL
jgi:hypothetical protein